MKAVLVSADPVDYTIAVVNGLAHHVEVHALLSRKHYEHLQRWIDPRVKVELLDWPRTRSPSYPAFLWRLTRIIDSKEPDVVHLLSNTSLWFNLAMPVWRQRPLVTTVHDVTLHPGDKDTARLPGWGNRLMAKQSPHLIVHGDGLHKAASNTFNKPESHIHSIPHPAIRRYADLAKEAGLRRSRPSNEFVVLLFGRIFAYKGLSTLIEAEKQLSDDLPELRLVIAGRGDNPNDLKHLMGHPERYEIQQGFIEDIDVAQKFVDADLVVLPYDEASQSGVLHLAAAFGKPVVVSDTGELKATVEPPRIGLVVPPRAPSQLATTMLKLARDPNLLTQLGENAIKWSESQNAPSSIGGMTAELYRKIVQTPALAQPN
jgi:glycosyltransferase involved in cell wall biosynthesis